MSLLSEISTYVTWLVSRDPSERLSGPDSSNEGSFCFSFHEVNVFNKG